MKNYSLSFPIRESFASFLKLLTITYFFMFGIFILSSPVYGLRAGHVLQLV